MRASAKRGDNGGTPGARAIPDPGAIPWLELCAFLKNSTEAEAHTLMEQERRSGRHRPTVFARIQRRYLRMKTLRERQEPDLTLPPRAAR